jgi:galactonate dehydratase
MMLEIYPYFPEIPGYVQVLEDSPEDRIKKGYLEIDAKPGLGVKLAAERVRPFLFAECDN